MLMVNELSKTAHVTPESVRHYVRIGLIKPKRNPSNGYKLFKTEDIKKVQFIRQAKGLGFTLSDIKKIFNHSHRGQTPCPIVRHIIQQRFDENKIKLAELNALQKRIELALEKWKTMPDGEPNGKAVCHLIESIKSF